MENTASAKDELGEQQTGIIKHATFKTFEEAEQCYLRAMQRLEDVYSWNQLAELSPERFSLLGSDAKVKYTSMEEKDFICIKFTERNEQSNGEDVLHVERIVTRLLGHKRSISVTTIPVRLIITTNSIERVIYNEVSYTFVVQLDETLVTAALYIRNENPEKKYHSTPYNKVLGSLKALFGSDIPFKKEWSTLLESLLK